MPQRSYYDVSDVMEILGVKQSKAYAIIRQLREELENKGFIPGASGKISQRYFNERYYCNENDIKQILKKAN